MITAEQHVTLLKPLNGTRVAKRSQGGKQLSYLESWEIKAHLIRVFGFGNFDLEMLSKEHLGNREYKGGTNKDVDMIEPMWTVTMQLTIRDPKGFTICRYSEAAVGTASAPANMLGEALDNALKTAASDATKRCAINLGTQFGLSLYDNGSLRDVVKGTLVAPEGVEGVVTEPAPDAPTAEQAEAVLATLGATEVKS